MGIFKSIGLFAVDIVKDMISDALQLEKYQKKNKLGKIETNYTGAIDGLQKRTAKWHKDTRKKYEECKKTEWLNINQDKDMHMALCQFILFTNEYPL